MAAARTRTRSTDVLAAFAPPVPADLAARAAAASTAVPSGARPSGSVVLVRDATDARAGVKVYLLHRHDRMPFAPSVAVFPGGGLEEVDRALPDPVLACALRETEEETTVRLGDDALVRWARWVTPEPEPRRYDTTFFLARMPPSQEAQDVSGETERAGWVLASDAVAARDAGRLALMPPTWSILLELAAAADVASLLVDAEGRQVRAVLPRVVPGGDGWRYAYEVVG